MSMDSPRPISTEVHSTYLKLTYQNLIAGVILIGSAMGLYFKIDQWHQDGLATAIAIRVRQDATDKRVDSMEAQYRVDHDALTVILTKLQGKP